MSSSFETVCWCFICELKGKNIILIYGQNQSGKSKLARSFLQSDKIIKKDKKDQQKDVVERNGKILFNDEDLNSKQIEFYALDNFENVNNEYLVEMPMSNKTSVMSKLINSINL